MKKANRQVEPKQMEEVEIVLDPGPPCDWCGNPARFTSTRGDHSICVTCIRGMAAEVAKHERIGELRFEISHHKEQLSALERQLGDLVNVASSEKP